MFAKRKLVLGSLLLTVLAVGISVAQRSRSRSRQGLSGGRIDTSMIDRNGVPDWENDREFKSDVFTFVRVQYSSYGGRSWGRRGGKWLTDYPDSDLNFSFRLQELTSLKVNPHGKIVQLTDDELFEYPFIYMIEPGNLEFSEDEVVALRKYLFNGGFLMVDDFWGDDEYRNFYYQIKRVFPNREPQELPLSHEIFNIVYSLKKKPQVPSIHAWRSGYLYEREGWGGDPNPHYKGIFDDEGRMMAIVCHNTDLGDGWEREGEDPDYFREMAERWSYPLGINIVTYAMTH